MSSFVPLLAQGAASAPAAPAPTLTIGPWALLLLALPVLLIGEQLVRRIGPIRRSNIPAPILGGLLAAVLILLLRETGIAAIQFIKSTALVGWHWLTLPQFTLKPMAAAVEVQQPLLVVFFTCIGLNASWSVAKRGGVALLVFLGLAGSFALVQGLVGALSAKLVGQDPLLGVMCSIVTLMGGFGTAAGFSPELERAGLHDAKSVGIAAAAFGVVAGGLLAGPIAARLMRVKVASADLARSSTDARSPGTGPLHPDVPIESLSPPTPDADTIRREGGFIGDLVNMLRRPRSIIIHLLVLAICLKLGAFLAVYAIDVGTALMRKLPGVSPTAKFVFPVYMGAMVIAVVLRNLHDVVAKRRFLLNDHIDLIAAVALTWMLAVYLMGLDLVALMHVAGPMLVILLIQVVLTATLAYWIVFRVMGRDYEAATMTAGMVGFGLGNTSNAVATMRSLAEQFGPAPRAFLIVTVVGAFLIDFVNSFLITVCINIFKH